MNNYHSVIAGITKFVDHELLPKISGLNKWLIGTASGIMASKGEHIFKELKENTLIKALDIIHDDMIDVACIYKELLKQASNGPIHIEVPMLGTLTLDHSDVEKLYRYIIED